MAQTLCQLKKKGGGSSQSNIYVIDTTLTSTGVTFSAPSGTHFMLFTAFSYGSGSSGELVSIIFDDNGNITGQNNAYLTVSNVSNKSITVKRSSNKTAYISYAIEKD